ncbi:MAG: hypothetical protein E2O72_04000 [Candidatus Dadabacteria bacterium]|nr:MAG: hypothetical protein E2O72_04000 [Candidatus Dadabacteria bacterium]TDI99411.1 MAG: hypothetical protein E2O70_07670 [Candidatus Dadabacteria bacterium]
MSDQEQPQGQEPGQMGNLANSILMAFNLGVQFNQQTQGTKSVTEVTGELGHTIYTNMTQVYGEQIQEDLLRTNTEYFLQIALMGYIVPSVCAYDEEFKNRLLQLIEMRAQKTQDQQPDGGSRIITT